jgi:hypothetical protein
MTSAPGTGTITVQYFAADTIPGDNQIKPHLNLVNTGTTTVSLPDVTVRYWYTIDGLRSQTLSCDFTPRGCGNVVGRFVPVSPPRRGADYYLEVGFTAGMGSLAPGQSTGEIMARFNKDDWTNFGETDDYSFDPTKTSFASWDRVTAYQGGTLIWGVEPAGATSQVAEPRARAADRDDAQATGSATGGCGVAGGLAGAPAVLVLVFGWIVGGWIVSRRARRVQSGGSGSSFSRNSRIRTRSFWRAL